MREPQAWAILIVAVAAGTAVILILAGVLLYRRYVNRRLAGKGRRLRLPAMRAVLGTLCIALAISTAALSVLYAYARQDAAHYRRLYEKYGVQQSYEYWGELGAGHPLSPYVEGMLAGHLPGYTLSEQRGGGFVCHAAIADFGTPDWLPGAVFFVEYGGEAVPEICFLQRERRNERGEESGGIGAFSPTGVMAGRYADGLRVTLTLRLKTADSWEELTNNFDTLPAFAEAVFTLSVPSRA